MRIIPIVSNKFTVNMDVNGENRTFILYFT